MQTLIIYSVYLLLYGWVWSCRWHHKEENDINRHIYSNLLPFLSFHTKLSYLNHSADIMKEKREYIFPLISMNVLYSKTLWRKILCRFFLKPKRPLHLMSQIVWILGLQVVYFCKQATDLPLCCWYCADIDPAWHITTCLQGLSVNNMPFYFSVASCSMIRPRCCPVITGKTVTCSSTILGGFSKLSWIHESVLLSSSQLTNWGHRICILCVHCTVSVHHARKPYHLGFFSF